MRAWLAFTIGIAVTACGPTAPSGSSATLVSLTIEPAITEVTVGSTMTLGAVGRYADGHTAPIVPTWSSDNTAAVMVDASGKLSAIRIGGARITAAVDTVNTTLDVRVAPAQNATWTGDFSGTWSGESLDLSCTRISGPGPSPCEGQEHGGNRSPTVFVVQQQSNAVACGVTIGGIVKYTGTFTGWVSEDAHLYLRGEVASSEGGVARLIDADFTISVTGTLIGTYSWLRVFQNAFGSQVLREELRVLDLTRTP